MSVQKGKTDVVFSGEMLETWQGVWQECIGGIWKAIPLSHVVYLDENA